MGRLLASMLRGKRRKYITLMAGVAVCIFFIMTVDTMYRGYCETQLGNAYSSGGNWDICVRIDGENYGRFSNGQEGLKVVGFHSSTYCLRLESVPEDKVYGGLKEYVTDYYLAVRGITGEEENMLPYHLTQGCWPESETEIVVPETLMLGNRSVAKGTIQIGDKFTLEYGRRMDENGTYTQEQISGKEVYELVGEREYTVCGFIQYPNYTTDKYVLYGYTGLSKAEEYQGEELVVYYRLPELSVKNLESVSKSLEAEDGVLEVQTNTAVAAAINIIEHSDYLHSIRLGLYLFEGLLILVGLCIAGANQYQSIVEDKHQIRLLHSIGAGKGQLCALYCMANLAVMLAGFVLSFCLYGIFLLLIRSSLLSNLRNSFFQMGSYAPDIRFGIFVLLLVTAVLLLLVCRLLLVQISVYKETGKQKKRAKQPELKSMEELSRSNNRTMRAKCRIQVLVSCVVLFAVPVFLAVFLSAYRIGESLTRQFSSDFYLNKKGYFKEIDDELYASPYVKQVWREAFSVCKICIPAEYIPKAALELIKERSNVISTKITENNELTGGITLLFIGEDAYNQLNKMNHGTMPAYEEFIIGDN